MEHEQLELLKMDGEGLTYRKFLAKFGIHLFPWSTFTEYQLQQGWAWWNAQPFRGEGYCRDKNSGEFFRFTICAEMRGKLQVALYILGPSLGMGEVPNN